jgi:hypothetical protein
VQDLAKKAYLRTGKRLAKLAEAFGSLNAQERFYLSNRMTINIDQLTEPDLIDLNRRIVERLRFLQQARAHVSMLKFRIGERVSFQADGRGTITGTITRYNKKSVTVVTDHGQRWNVSPVLLRPEADESVVEGTAVSSERPRLEG